MKKLMLICALLAVLTLAGNAWAIEDDGIVYGELTYILGHNDDVGTTFETVGDLSAASNFLATASTLEVSSSSTDDETTGAVTVVLKGLDANYDSINETITMTGQTGAVSVKYFLRINQMYVASAGSTGTNVGDIYAHRSATTSGVPDTATAIYSMIKAGAGSSKIAAYTTPRRKLSTIKSLFQTATASGAFRVRKRTAGGPWTTIDYTTTIGGDTSKQFAYVMPIEPRTDIVVEAFADTTSECSVNVEFRTKP